MGIFDDDDFGESTGGAPQGQMPAEEKTWVQKEIDPDTVTVDLAVAVKMDKAIDRPGIELINQALRLYEDAGFTIRISPPHKDNADQALATKNVSRIETACPWRKFESNGKECDCDYNVGQRALILYGKIVPFFDKVNEKIRKIVAVSISVFMGKYVSSPAQAVVIWTPDGCTKTTDITRETGFESSMIRIAARYSVPVLNAKNPDFLEKVQRHIRSFVDSTQPKTGNY